MAKKKLSSSDTRLLGELANRTGLKSSSHAEAMLEDARIPSQGSPEQFLDFRKALMEGAPPIGTMPRPPSLTAAAQQAVLAATGEKTNVLLDKIAERLAFERTGTRLYEGLLLKHELADGFAGGPNRDELLEFRDEELAHFRLLERALEELHADPTALTPSADRTAVESSGVGAVIADARTDLSECLEAMLVAELADHDAWERLIELTRELGHGELAEQFEHCHRQEERHLQRVRGWVSARTRDTAGAA